MPLVAGWYVLPDDTEYLYAVRNELELDETRHSRVIAYGQPRGDGTDEELWIEIGGTPRTAAIETLDVGGIEWSIGSWGGGWSSAFRLFGDTLVTVAAAGEPDESILRGLLVIDEADLVSEPLGDIDDATVVARTDVGDATLRYLVQQHGVYACHWVDSSDGVTGGCSSIVEPGAAASIDTGSTAQLDVQPGTADVVRGGSVRSDATLVEVQFADGSTVSVEPTDLSGTFDRRFWIVAATISSESRTGLSVFEEAVAEVRVYDEAGDLVGTVVPEELAARPPASTVPDLQEEPSDESDSSSWRCRAVVRPGDTIDSIADRFRVGPSDVIDRLGTSEDGLRDGELVEAPCEFVAGWEGGEVTTVVETPIVLTTGAQGLEPIARLFGLGASGARVEVGPVADGRSLLQIDVFQRNGELAWGGGLAVDTCTGGLRFDDPPITTVRTPVVRLRCAEPDMQVSIRLLDEQISTQTDARITVANNTTIGGIAGWLTEQLADVYSVNEAVNAGPDAPDLTAVLYRPGFELAAQSLATQLGIDVKDLLISPLISSTTDTELTDGTPDDHDVLIMLGSNFQPGL